MNLQNRKAFLKTRFNLANQRFIIEKLTGLAGFRQGLGRFKPSLSQVL